MLPENRTTKSQNDEVVHVRKYFKDYQGTVLDIGAGDGCDLSNSYDLIQQDLWAGVLLEPEHENFMHLSNLYGGIENVSIYPFGIHKTTGVQKFLVNGYNSTTSVGETERTGLEYKQSVALFLSWSDFLKTFHPGRKFDFITIDAEGVDWLILSQINLAEVGCKCLCIEHNGDQLLLNRYVAYCSAFKMKEIHRNTENIIFALPN
jgi:FkbM family methyltransferase